jgi:hypothetical protein
MEETGVLRMRSTHAFLFSLFAIAFTTISLISCASKPVTLSERDPAAKRSTTLCGVDTSELTVWTLHDMAQAGRTEELNCLFDNGASTTHLPDGYSAGMGARVLGSGGGIGRVLGMFTNQNWRGKIFFPGTATESHGLNRIKAVLFGTPDVPITPMGAFTTKLLQKGEEPLAPNVKSTVVILNYANPYSTKPPWLQERILRRIPVYDVMVAIPGKYGRDTLYLGKTWLGKYDKNGDFHADNPDKLIAYYFLDFSDGAFKAQYEEHWDGSKEKLIDHRKY